MHEMALMQQAMDIVFDSACSADAIQVTSVRMRVGKGAGVVPDALEFAFGVLTADTIAAGATLTIDHTPVVCNCKTCRCAFTPEGDFYVCPVCGATSTEILSGREFELESIEVV